ncbi:MAG: 2-oxoglutarate dehydrogenase complex dihydrolipoyllysine-residue succinyltransferase [Capsulimonadales bacterium]|nr:2-oxoglutarate dehydrogenase complex dihydrolipoyllysine-residue succinyltransferase [Capsulimonadales bacterium]
MPVEIRVPQLGESIVEATIAQWLKKPGDVVSVGDELVELETEKVNQVVEAEAAGVLGEITHHVGETVGVGEVLGVIGDGTGAVKVDEAAASVPPTMTQAEEARAREQSGQGEGYTAPAAPAGNAGAETVTPAATATPVAEKMAQENGIDLSTLKATGPNNRIGKSDVVHAIEQARSQPQTAETKRQEVAEVRTPPVAPAAPPVAPPKPTPSTAGGRPEERLRMTGKRKAIANNLKQAQNIAASLTTFNEIDLSKVIEIRKRRKDDFQKKFGVGLGFMSFFTKASIGALKQFPYVNGEIQGDEIVLKKYYDIGIAVGVEDGLVVPILRDADKMSFAEIEKKIGELAGKAKEGKLGIADMLGGTFTITNGGVFGSLLSTPILNYPQVGILGLHAIKERPVVVDGEIVIRPIMMVALSYDHRIIDGSTAVRFLVKIKELIEDPETLLLEG